MKRFLIIIFSGLLLTACGASADKASGSGSAVKLKVGDTVVFKLSRGSYGEGKIETIDGSRYKIPFGTTTPTVDESDVYSLPNTGTNSNVKVGDFVIAKQDNQNSWVPAEVTKSDGKAIEVKTIFYKQTLNLSPAQVVEARPAAIEEFKALKTEVAFEAKVSSMRPAATRAYIPKNGDRVVAAWSGNSWYTGTIVETGGDKVTVKWADNSSDSKVDAARIALFPALGSTGTPFQSGDTLLVKPTSGSNWKFAEATSSREVRFNDGTTRSVRGDEYVLFN